MKYERSQKIVQLMRESTHDTTWLIEAVSAGIELELATIPIYLCARWSINESGTALDSLRAIVRDEMAHMGLMCNLLKGLGVAPRIIEMAPSYPGPLPGGVRPELTVYLSGLGRESLEKVMMAIEAPEEPLAAEALTETFTSVGAFYDAIAAALASEQPSLSTAGQLSRPDIGMTMLATVDQAIEAMTRIREQGEGTSTSPFFQGKLAHYYLFGSIFHGHQLEEASPGKFAFSGAEVKFPEVLPMAHVPAGGWPNRDPDGQGTLKAFNDLYGAMLQKLEDAWGSGGMASLNQAVFMMLQMTVPARKLMRVPLETGGGNYGPDFVIR
jgi:Ferritin-like